MKKIVQYTSIVSMLLVLCSFTSIPKSDCVGTYGVCENDPSRIELTLNEDKTFTYKDYSNPTEKINVNGNWELKNKHILLKDYNSEFSFHSKWKIVKDGMVAKSRKGLTFYTLVKK